MRQVFEPAQRQQRSDRPGGAHCGAEKVGSFMIEGLHLIEGKRWESFPDYYPFVLSMARTWHMDRPS
jgi:hypothetical protein